MEKVKGMLSSKTIWGVIISVVSKGAFLLGYDVTGLEGADVIITGLIGDLLAVYGRIKAVKIVKIGG